MTDSYAQLSALGYWDVGGGSVGLDPNNTKSICNNIVMDSSKVNTILVMHYNLLLACLLLVVLLEKIILLSGRGWPSTYRDLLAA
jgi:hypothetical protein